MSNCENRNGAEIAPNHTISIDGINLLKFLVKNGPAKISMWGWGYHEEILKIRANGFAEVHKSYDTLYISITQKGRAFLELLK